MDYFKILNLDKEPFSNSPDPAFFYESKQHVACLQKLELSFRLQRGLNVIIGDVGTGKTTLCRRLINKFADDDAFETHLILDPFFADPKQFLLTMAGLLTGNNYKPETPDRQLKEEIKHFLFAKGVDQKKTTTLIIDEGQKLKGFCLEILREFLNYETNEYKLLQIVIFAQKEFESTLKNHANFSDRISLYHELKPLGFKDTSLMIRFRLEQAKNQNHDGFFFSYPALWAVYQATQGYPRKIINLCHQIVLAMIIQNRLKAHRGLVRSCAKRTFPRQSMKGRFVLLGFLFLFALVMLSAELTVRPFQKILQAHVDERTTTVFEMQTTGKPIANVPVTEKTKPEETTRQTLLMLSDNRADPKRTSDQETTKPSTRPIGDKKSSDEKQSDEQVAFPAYLGKVTLKSRETLWKLVEKVYGVYSDQHFRLLAQANAQIHDPNHVMVGQSILVPAVSVPVKPRTTPFYWIKIGETEQLNHAVALLRLHPQHELPVRLVSCWKKETGLKFVLVLKELFNDRKLALYQLEKLSPSIRGQASIIDSWGKDTVFFSDPFSTTS